jgi:hypothetical protein
MRLGGTKKHQEEESISAAERLAVSVPKAGVIGAWVAPQPMRSQRTANGRRFTLAPACWYPSPAFERGSSAAHEPTKPLDRPTEGKAPRKPQSPRLSVAAEPRHVAAMGETNICRLPKFVRLPSTSITQIGVRQFSERALRVCFEECDKGTDAAGQREASPQSGEASVRPPAYIDY